MAPGGPVSHEHGHGMGSSSATYIATDDALQIASSGKDGRIKIWSPAAEMQKQSDDMDCDGPMHSLAVSPDAQIIAAGTDQSILIYDAKSLDFIQTAATTQFAVRSLSFAPTGGRLAAAGDDPGLLIVAIDIKDESCVKHTISVGPNTRCVAWDPAGTYIALAQTNGTIQIWDASTQQEVWKDRCAPAVSVDAPSGLHVAWHPLAGRSLLTPSFERPGDVKMFERLRWGRKGSRALSGVHTDTVSHAAFCPNGRYVATASLDQQIAVWDVAGTVPAIVLKHTVGAVVLSLAWHPAANELLAALTDGTFLRWPDVVPGHMVAPHIAMPEPTLMPDSERLGAPLPELRTQLNADLAGVADAAAAQPPDAAVRRPGDASDDDDDDGPGAGDGPADDVGDTPANSGGFVPAGELPGWRGGGAAAVAAAARSAGPPPQPPFQPGACPADEHYLMQYNVVGRVVRKPLEDQFVVDTIYHDNARHRKRMPPIRPSHDFALAALSGAGVALASKLTRQSPAMVRYEPYESLATRGGWERQLADLEQPVSLAVGDAFVAVATDSNTVHVFTSTGVHTDEVAVGGAVVAVAAHGPLLAVAWHRAAPTPAGDQCMDLLVLNVANRCAVSRGPLPLSPKTTLTWLALASDTLTPVTMDSGGVVRAWSPTWGGAWARAFTAAEDHPGMRVWPAGVTGGELHFVQCDSGDVPQPTPMPVTLSKPLTCAAPPAHEEQLTELEGQHAAQRARIACLRHGSAVEAASPRQEALGASLAAAATEADKTALRLFNGAILAENPDRALQLIATCNNEITMAKASKLAHHRRKNALAERVEALREWRFAEPPAEPGLGSPTDDFVRPASPPVAAAPSPLAPSPAPLGARDGNSEEATAAAGSGAAKKRPAMVSKNPFARKAAKR
eukprot:jgi/Ulvmu1/6499/UM003_0132.1